MTDEPLSSAYKLHSCSYYCHPPECIKAQRDYLRDRVLELESALSDLDQTDKPRNLIGLV